VLDLVGNSIKATISVGALPWEITVSADGTSAYVTHIGSFGGYDSINTQTGAVTTVLVGANVSALASSPDGTRVYATLLGTLASIDVTTNKIITQVPLPFPIVGDPREIAVSPDGRLAYVLFFRVDIPANSAIAVVDTLTNTVTETITGTGRASQGIALSSDGTQAYITNITSFPDSRICVSY
jgi:DNA-binding beta-propeller fold protein YncE